MSSAMPSTRLVARSSDGFAPLTRAVDAFGNEVAYEYGIGSSLASAGSSRSSWGQNAAAGLTDPFARVVFNWIRAPQCGDIETGSQRDYRTGTLIVTGASKLMSITATAFPPGSPTTPEHARAVTLDYSAADESCTTTHAPLRLLTSIQESAFGTDSPRVDLPAVTFEYGDATIDHVTPRPPLPGAPWAGSEPRRRNLGWGYRRTDGRWPTVEAMMLDLDGDGLLDRVSNASTEGTDGQCRARWRRNLGPAAGTGNLQFGAEQTFTLPRLKWNGTTTQASPLAGAATADPAFPHFEGCALNGQFTAFRNSQSGWVHHHRRLVRTSPTGGSTWMPTALSTSSLPCTATSTYTTSCRATASSRAQPRPPEPDLFGPWPACPSQMDRCKAVSASCTAAARTCPAGGPCTSNGAALNACLASAATLGCRELINRDLQSPQLLPPGHDPRAPISQAPYTRCEGLYPWFIYKNTGNGTFASPVIKYQPVQLESDFGDSSIISSVVAAQYHGVLDFDGDGVLDAIVRPNDPNGSYWFVWLGDGTGGFGPRRYTFPTRPAPRNLISGIGAFGAPGGAELGGPVRHQRRWPPRALAHQQQSQCQPRGPRRNPASAPFGSPPTGELETRVKPGNDAKATVTSHSGQLILAGDSTATNRTVDVDHDGRIDIVQYLPGAARPIVFFNVGGQFITPGVAYPRSDIPGFGDFTGFLRQTEAIDDLPGGFPPELSWELSGDLMDLDGDGIAEAAYFGANGFVRARQSAIRPPRLLYRVHNGRGAHTTIEYASMHDKTAVEQHPEQTWSDGRPKASPHTQWVVKSLTVVDDFAATTSTTSQFYKNPRHGADDEGRYSFRGFEEVTTTAPSGAKTVQRYGYAPDWSGRLVDHARPARRGARPRCARSTRRPGRSANSSTARSRPTTRTITEHFTCANGQTEATCTARRGPWLHQDDLDT